MTQFPTNFLWGTATASYQIEGAVTEGGRGPSIWDTFTRKPGAILNGDTGDVAIDHYHHLDEDVDILKTIGAEYYRFSIAWPRIFPSGKGTINREGIDFYKRLLDRMEENGVRPWVTLYHWDLPQALQDGGGWAHRDTAHHFADYSSAVQKELGDRIHGWTTLNEPFCSAFYGYASGVQAPGITDPIQALAAGHHLMLGHGLAVQRIREADPDAQIGITLNLSPTVAATPSAADQAAARRIDARKNRFFLDPLFTGTYPADMMEEVQPLGFDRFIQDGDLSLIHQPLDFLGVNYYRRFVVRELSADVDGAVVSDDEAPLAGAVTPYVGCEDIEFVPSGLPTSTMGWEVDPEGLRQLLVRIWNDWDLPALYITENGMALDDHVNDDGRVVDTERIQFMLKHLESAYEAIKAGVDLRGYFAWSSFDNFEWALGLEKRFGLVHVDYNTQVRTLKDSAHWYRKVVKTGVIQPIDAVEPVLHSTGQSV